MKKILILVIAVSLSSIAFSQKQMAEAKIIALEKAGWQAWKNRDTAWYKANTTDDFLQVFGDGMHNRAEVIQLTATECAVKSFSLANFKFVLLSENVGLLTYIATQDAVCDGKKNKPKVRVSVNYVNRGGKWLEAFYMETPVTQ